MVHPRPVQRADTPGIIELVRQVYREYGYELDLTEDRHLLDPGGYFRAHGGEFWVIEADGAIRATAGVLLHADAAELKTLYADARYRGRGWGRLLVETAQRFARAAGKRRFLLWSDTRFREAHGLYRHMGFAEVGYRLLEDVYRSTEFGFEIVLQP